MVEFGWISTRNFDGKFRNVTLGLINPTPEAGKYSQTAAWSRANYIGQVSLVLIVDASLEIERLADTTTGPYFEMIEAARTDGIALNINSGFRTYSEQKWS